MNVWKYKAIALTGDAASFLSGEIVGESAAIVRAKLRRSGLQVIQLQPLRQALESASWLPAREWWRAHLRQRRRLLRAELYDGLVTMLQAGIPLAEAIDTCLRSLASGTRLRPVLVQVREDVRSGSSLGDAMKRHPSWFHPIEVAMVEAGQHAGNLPHVLRVLSERNESAGELAQKLVTALTYPAIVALVGLAVLVFLSTKTLPDLVLILQDSQGEIPPLTEAVMAVGQGLARYGWTAVLAILALTVLVFWGRGLAGRWGWRSPARLRRLYPRTLRRVALARVAAGLSQLIRSGVPVVEALRVLAPSVAPAALREQLRSAAGRVERGEDLPSALDDELWFDAEFRRLLSVGQASGELDDLLERMASRSERRARRLIDRLATLLEPTAILTLAVLIAMVVMAAILPVLRLQEVM